MRSLYQSKHYTSYQCDRGRNFIFEFEHKVIKLSFCQLLAFRQKVKNINLDTHFNGENNHGLEFVFLCNREHMFIFNTHEIIELKEFIQGTFQLLELNSLVA